MSTPMTLESLQIGDIIESRSPYPGEGQLLLLAKYSSSSGMLYGSFEIINSQAYPSLNGSRYHLDQYNIQWYRIILPGTWARDEQPEASRASQKTEERLCCHCCYNQELQEIAPLTLLCDECGEIIFLNTSMRL